MVCFRNRLLTIATGREINKGRKAIADRRTTLRRVCQEINKKRSQTIKLNIPPMIGIVVELAVSWLLLWLTYRKNLSVLGFTPTTRRLLDLSAGLLLAASCCTIYQLLTTSFVNNRWMINKEVTVKSLLPSLKSVFVSVVYEELIFRGALLYIAIKKLDIVKAVILSAACFGVYHWFSFAVVGNPFMMVVTFCMTAIVGLAWAYAFAKTGSVYLPVGLHFGWNLVSQLVFANGNHAHALFTRLNDNSQQGLLSLLVFLFQVLALPLLSFWYLAGRSGEWETIRKKSRPSSES